MQLRVLIVDKQNMHRSPIGEVVLRNLVKKRNLDVKVDSCGISDFYAGEQPSESTITICKNHSITLSHIVRQITMSDFTKFTHILAVDEKTLRDLTTMEPHNATAVVRLWGSYVDWIPIPRPGDDKKLEEVYQLCKVLSKAFLDEIFEKDTMFNE